MTGPDSTPFFSRSVCSIRSHPGSRLTVRCAPAPCTVHRYQHRDRYQRHGTKDVRTDRRTATGKRTGTCTWTEDRTNRHGGHWTKDGTGTADEDGAYGTGTADEDDAYSTATADEDSALQRHGDLELQADQGRG